MAELFDEKIALFNQKAENKEEALKILADEFMKKGVGKDTFYDAILAREKTFATGLSCNNMCVAIPHTDPEHVNKVQLGFMTLEKPVDFIEMGTDDKHIGVTLIIMMALKEAHQQLDMLMKLMDVFQNDEVMDRLSKTNNFDELYTILKEVGLDNA